MGCCRPRPSATLGIEVIEGRELPRDRSRASSRSAPPPAPALRGDRELSLTVPLAASVSARASRMRMEVAWYLARGERGRRQEVSRRKQEVCTRRW